MSSYKGASLKLKLQAAFSQDLEEFRQCLKVLHDINK